MWELDHVGGVGGGVLKSRFSVSAFFDSVLTATHYVTVRVIGVLFLIVVVSLEGIGDLFEVTFSLYVSRFFLSGGKSV